MKKRVALAIRPYGERLRPRVFALLSQLRIEVDAPAELGDEVSNDDIVRHMAARRADLLLIPFHVVRTRDGDRTSGLELLERLRQEVPWTRRAPVIMPVSVFAGAAFERLWREHPVEGVFPLLEDDIEKAATLRAFGEFLGAGAPRGDAA